MQVTGSSSSLPLSTQIIKKAGQAAQSPEAPASPEQVNSAVDRASDRVSETQASREQNQTERRAYAAQLYSANSQQKQIDTYLAVASDGQVDSTSGSTKDALELSDNDAVSRLDNPDSGGRQRPDFPPERPQPYVDARA